MTAMVAPASAEPPDARASLKGEDADALPFELALQTELELLAPLADVALGKGIDAGETSDLTDALTASDKSDSSQPACSLAILAAAESLLQPTAATPQLILPALTPPPPPPLATPSAEEPVAPAIAAATSATAASATLVPMAMAQLRSAEPASTGPVERASEKTFARHTGVAAIPTATPAAEPGEKGLEGPGAGSTGASEVPRDAGPAPTRPRLPETANEAQPDKRHVRGESPTEVQASAPRVEAERAPVRLEQPLAVEMRPDAPVTPSPAANVSTTPAPTFTAPHVSQYTAPQSPAAATAHIQTPFGQTEWTEQFREKVVWLVDRQQQTAELHIHPPHLGPVEVMLTLNDDRTSIAFVSPHPAVREAIEASFADLRATLEERGLNLGHASVSADARDAREQLPQNAQSSGRRFPGGIATAEDMPLQRALLQRGLVDTFA